MDRMSGNFNNPPGFHNAPGEPSDREACAYPPVNRGSEYPASEIQKVFGGRASEVRMREASLPPTLSAQLDDLEKWAIYNKRDARNDLVAFWFLKIPAILSSASAGILAHYSLATVSMFAGAIASVCVIVDGIHPRGMLRNTHLRAYHDIRFLASTMAIKWRSRNPASKVDNVVAGIIRDGEAERGSTYVTRKPLSSLRAAFPAPYVPHDWMQPYFDTRCAGCP